MTKTGFKKKKKVCSPALNVRSRDDRNTLQYDVCFVCYVGVVDVDGRRKPNAPIYARLIR